jgi:hypothetical protein
MATTIQQPNPEEIEEGQVFKVINKGEGLTLKRIEDSPEDKSYGDERRDSYKGQHYRRLPYNARFQNVTVVRAEIEMPDELYAVITRTILEYNWERLGDFITARFMERMKQIMTDPKEFGKLMLDGVKAAHCLEDCELD